MLTSSNGSIYESLIPPADWTTTSGGTLSMHAQTSNCIDYGQYTITPYWQWSGYPVYVCHDKTKKAIEVLKCLQREKLIKKIDDVDGFIAMVEKISSLL